MIESLSQVSAQARTIAEGNYDISIEPRHQKDELGLSMSQMVLSLQNIGRVAESVAQGDYDITIEPKSEKDRLSRAMNQMLLNLRAFSQESDKEQWIKTGLAELSVVMRGGLGIGELADKVLTFLANYLNAKIGVFYVVEDTGNATLAASYAYTRRKSLSSEIKPGEGLVGQVLKEGKVISLSNVPEDYIEIHSGLGELAPRNIIVQPLIYERNVKGIIELGAFESFTDNQLELLNQISETIAVSIKSAADRERMQELLEETQQNSEELQRQQEELKSANETLEEQAQALKQSEEKLKAQKAMLEESNEALRLKTDDLERQKSEVEKARAELQKKAEQLAVTSKYKSEFLANMSHELRTPLNSLLLLSQSLACNKDANLTEEQVEDLNVIHGGGQSLLNLINDILDLSKVEAGKLRIVTSDVDLQELFAKLQEQFKLIAEEQQIDFQISFSKKMNTHLLTDEQRLEQILRNLLSNSFKFTPNGKVLLKAELANKDDLSELSQVNSDDVIAIRVEDTGIGVPESKQKEIFEAFQQADGSTSRAYGGTGLGLTISRELAALLGGEIRLHSVENEGSVFTLYIPRSISELAQPAVRQKTILTETRSSIEIEPMLKEIRAPGREQSNESNALLIVEDDSSFAKILEAMAEKHGFDTLVANTGKDAIALANEKLPAAIVLDMGLPDMDGLEVLERLKSSTCTRKIPVHIVSAQDEEVQTLNQGALGFLVKPASEDELEKVFSIFETLIQKDIKQLLLIEDDQATCRAIRKYLTDKRVDIQVAHNGAEGVDWIRKQKFDCCILDLTLPDMSGFDFLNQIDTANDIRMPPVIVYTGQDLNEEEYKILMKYTDKIVIKDGVSPERLQEEVELFLHSVVDRLPVSLVRKQEHSELKSVDITGRKILVVDDDLRNTYALSKVLKEQGLSVTLADNGKLALEKLQQDEDIDLVLMDIMMPVMDGYEAMKHIREKISRSVPIIALTAKAMAADRDKCIEAGANDYMAKPVDVNNLLSMVKVWLYH